MSKTTEYILSNGIYIDESGNDSPPERELYESLNKPSESEINELLEYWND